MVLSMAAPDRRADVHEILRRSYCRDQAAARNIGHLPCRMLGFTDISGGPMAKYGKKAQSKVKRAMHDRRGGTLKPGRSGKKVTSRKQAIAIGLSEARRASGKVPKKSSKRTTAKRSTSKRNSTKRSTSRRKAS